MKLQDYYRPLFAEEVNNEDPVTNDATLVESDSDDNDRHQSRGWVAAAKGGDLPALKQPSIRRRCDPMSGYLIIDVEHITAAWNSAGVETLHTRSESSLTAAEQQDYGRRPRP